MQRIPLSTDAGDTDTTMGASKSTRKFTCHGPFCTVQLVGTWGGGTITLKSSPLGAPGGTFTTHATPDASGTVANVTFTKDDTIVLVGQDISYRLDSDGSVTDVDIWASGQITVHPVGA